MTDTTPTPASTVNASRHSTNQALEILHHDDDIVVINKPSGLLSVPGRYQPDCAVSRLEAELGDIRVIHRLDMDTSGLLVFARHKQAQANIQQQFEKQTTSKVYEALLYGHLPGNQGCINMPIMVDWPNRPLQMIAHSEGRYALTRWRKTEQGHKDGLGYSRVLLFPKTGRSHQLRLHSQQLGHPILGDTLYAKTQLEEHAARGLNALEQRLCLHAKTLAFKHPGTGEQLTFHCPADF